MRLYILTVSLHVITVVLKTMQRDHLLTSTPKICCLIMLHSLWMNFFSLLVVHVTPLRALMASITRCCLTSPLLRRNFSCPCLTGFGRSIDSRPGEMGPLTLSLSLGRIPLFRPAIVPSASLPIFVKQWNAWSTTALSLSWRRKTC
jgi:hypothetical protein